MDDLTPKDPGEAAAIFRSHVIGPLLCRELSRGELRAELRALSQQAFRPPGWDRTHRFGVSTLERWFYRYRHGGLEALRPKPRKDRGHGRELSAEEKALICDIRREHPRASAALILRTLEADGRFEKGRISLPTLRRLFREQGLDRQSLALATGARPRLRWQADRPGALWHGDVCHGPALSIDGRSAPLRIHGLLDDASRYVVALEARHTERESDMIDIFVAALRRHGRPAALYLDNGATYRGEELRTVCARLGITLIHAQPYDPMARGKMERFWRTLRQGYLDFLGSVASLGDVEVRLRAYLDRHYHVAPHASLMGRSPSTVWGDAERATRDLDEATLRDALTMRTTRRLRRDSTLSVDGLDFELDQGFLAGRLVTVARCLLDRPARPWVEHEGKRLELHLVDAEMNGHRRRRRATDAPSPSTPFDPVGALLDRDDDQE